MAHIYVFGSVNLDYVAEVPRLPLPGETLTGSNLSLFSGGKGGNQAHGAAGVSAVSGAVSMVGCVGDDSDGVRLLSDLRNHGVDVSTIVTVPVQSGIALITVDAESENTIVVIPGANHAWPANLVSSVPLAAGDVVVVQLEIPFEEVRALAEYTRSAGAHLILNAAPSTSRIAELFPLIDTLVVNETEAADIFGIEEQTADAVAALAPVFPGNLVLTMGRHGALVTTGDGRVDVVPAFAVDAVDTVGAGDAFVGALAVGVAEGLDLAAAARLGAGAGALTATVRGARHPELTREAVDALIARG